MLDIERSEQAKEPEDIRRVFLIDAFPSSANSATGTYIRQGSLEVDEDGSKLVISERSGVYTCTRQYGSGVVRGAVEEGIRAGEFMSLWGKATERIEKHRYTIPYMGAVIKLDEYRGELEGYVLAEVIFRDDAAAAAFDEVKPGWLGLEVTGDTAYMSQELAIHGWPEPAVE